MLESMLHPSVYVFGKEHSGSGTIVFSAPLAHRHRRAARVVRTYVLTNLHVVDENLLYRFSRRSLLSAKKNRVTARERWVVTRDPLTVRVYRFKHEIGPLKHRDYKADIVACDKACDLALLRIRSERVFPCAILAPRETRFTRDDNKVWAVGCPADSYPFRSREGEVVGISDEKIFSTTEIHLGSSGGGLYRLRDERYEIVGVTTEMQLSGTNPVSHMAYSVHVKTIHEFLEKSGFGFILKNGTKPAA